MAKGTIKIEGLSELVEGLTEELPKATATNVMKRVLTKAGKPIQEMAQQMAPKRTGLLAEKITVSSKLSPRQKSDLQKGSKIEIYVGPPSMSRAIVQEFGSVFQTPQPFMRPSWDANKRSAFDSLKDDMEEEIEKARQRIARKAAKLKAK